MIEIPDASIESKRQRRIINRGRQRQYDKRRKADKPEHVRALHRESNRRWRLKNPEKVKEIYRRWCEKNTEKRRKYNHEWRRRNRESRNAYGREYGRIWRKQNAAKAREYARRWYRKNKEHVLAYNRRWQAENPEKARAQRQRRYLKNPAKVYERVLYRRAVKRGAQTEPITASVWQSILTTYGHRCAYCGKEGPLTRDHVIPLSRGGPHSLANLVPACRSCNAKKGVKLVALAQQDSRP